MKKIIWVGMNKNGGTYVFTGAKPIAKNGELCPQLRIDGAWYSELLDLELKPLEIVEIIIDTETQSYEIKREREIGWYVVECKSVEDDGLTFACHWNGKNWNPVRNKKKWRTGVIWEGLNEDEVTVISDKLPDNEYLRSLE